MNEQLILDVLRPAVEALGLSVWGLEIENPGRRKVLRLYVEKPGGVSVGECAKASRHAGLALEVEDAVPGSYILEVSSPGFERRFFHLEQMQPYVGRDVRVQLEEPLEGRKNFKGELSVVADDRFTLLVDEEAVELHWRDVKRARLVHDFEQKA
ncbi:MAG: ribosome maturation factor RimP [Desulfovibrionales bacterium]|nr:ribosome maturation factor RimP [Desulfovibrionales bacterium]